MELISEAVRDAFKIVEVAYDERASHGLKVLSGFEELDTILSGFYIGDMHVVCGEPGVGKSSFVYNIALNLGVKAKPPISVALFCLDRTPELLALRVLCAEGDTSYTKTIRGNISKDDWPKLTSAAGRLANSRIHINYSDVGSVQDLIVQVSNLVAKESNISILIIDSLQKLASEDKAKISECLRTLKAAALQLRLPIILTSSIDMMTDQRDKGPMVKDPIYSVITKYSDVVLILHRDEYDKSLHSNKESHSCRKENALISRIKTELIIAKNTNGLTGSVFLDYMPQYGRFQDVDERPHSAKVEWSDAY